MFFASAFQNVAFAAQLAVVQAFPLASHKGEAFFAGGGGDGRSGHRRGITMETTLHTKPKLKPEHRPSVALRQTRGPGGSRGRAGYLV